MSFCGMNTIKSGIEISEIFNLGKRASSRELRIIVKRVDDQRGPSGRVAFIAGKKLGNAVVRNRNKRILREVARANNLPAEGYDILVQATPQTVDTPYTDLVCILGKLLGKAGVGHERG